MSKTTKAPKKSPHKKKTHESLFEKIDRVNDKLQIMITLSRSMPMFILSIGAILFAITYLRLSVINLDQEVSELPQTGEVTETQTTSSFQITSPSHKGSIYLPYVVSAESEEAFAQNIKTVTFYGQNNGNNKFVLSETVTTIDNTSFETSWEKCEPGNYYLWAQIDTTSDETFYSSPILVTVSESSE